MDDLTPGMTLWLAHQSGGSPGGSGQRCGTPKRRQHAFPGRKVQSARVSRLFRSRPHDIHTVNKHRGRWVSTDPLNHGIFVDANLSQTIHE